MIYAFYTPTKVVPINKRRAGTIRVGWDNPQFVKITAGFDSELFFTFRDHTQQSFMLTGRNLSGIVYDQSGIEVLNKSLTVDATDQSVAKFQINKFESRSLIPGLYNLIISYTDDAGIEQVANTARSNSRFVLEIIDFSAPL